MSFRSRRVAARFDLFLEFFVRDQPAQVCGPHQVVMATPANVGDDVGWSGAAILVCVAADEGRDFARRVVARLNCLGLFRARDVQVAPGTRRAPVHAECEARNLW